MFSGAKDGVGSFNRVVRQGDNNENWDDSTSYVFRCITDTGTLGLATLTMVMVFFADEITQLLVHTDRYLAANTINCMTERIFVVSWLKISMVVASSQPILKVDL